MIDQDLDPPHSEINPGKDRVQKTRLRESSFRNLTIVTRSARGKFLEVEADPSNWRLSTVACCMKSAVCKLEDSGGNSKNPIENQALKFFVEE